MDPVSVSINTYEGFVTLTLTNNRAVPLLIALDVTFTGSGSGPWVGPIFLAPSSSHETSGYGAVSAVDVVVLGGADRYTAYSA